MEEPLYTLHINESVLMPDKVSAKSNGIRITVFIAVFVILFMSVLFGEDIFRKLKWFTQIMLIGLIIWYIFLFSNKTDVPSPMEIMFYTDHLTLFRPKRYYSKRITRKEYIQMKYCEIEYIKYKKAVRRFHIYGTVAAKYYRYISDTEIEKVPSYDRAVEGTLCYFSTRDMQDDDSYVIEAFRKYSPCNVIIE